TVLLATAHGLGVWAGIALAPLAVGLVGVLVERAIVRFLYGRMLDTMLATWGLSLARVGLVTLVFGPTTEGVATPLGFFTVGRYSLPYYNVLVVGVALAALALTYGLFNFTRAGLVARATMQYAGLAAGLRVTTACVYIGTCSYGSALVRFCGSR